MQPTERHVFAVVQPVLDVPGQQTVFPRQIVQVLLERLVLEFHGLHDLQILEQVRLVVVLDRERRLFHQVRYVRLVELVQRLRVVESRQRQVRRRSLRGRLLGPAARTREMSTPRGHITRRIFDLILKHITCYADPEQYDRLHRSCAPLVTRHILLRYK